MFLISSFAYTIIFERCPVLLSEVCETLKSEWIAHLDEINATDAIHLAKVEVNFIISEIRTLQKEISSNEKLKSLKYEAASDFVHWEATLMSFSKQLVSMDWLESPWQLTELYIYRRLIDILSQTKHFSTYDPFRTLKRNNLINNLPQIRSILEVLPESKDDIDESTLKSWFELSLWGNRCDLSHQREIEKISDIFEDLRKLRPNILINELDEVVDKLLVIKSSNQETIMIDIVLDNSGFELFADLCLLDVLTIFVPKQTTIRIHVKKYPWVVSDATKRDVIWTIDLLANDQQSNELKRKANQWHEYLQTGKWTICEHDFWTYYNSFCEMSLFANDLYQQLVKSALIIFKGDLNHLKLLSSLDWPHDTEFRIALRGFAPTFLVTLRVIKCDSITGLNYDTLAVELPKNWMIDANFALIQTAKPE